MNPHERSLGLVYPSCIKSHFKMHLIGKWKTLKCRNGVGGPCVPPDQLSPQTCGPRTSCPPGRVVLGPNVLPGQDVPHCEVSASLSSDGKLGVGPENKAG